MELCNVRPPIEAFYQAVEGKLTGRAYPRKNVGRYADGLIYITGGKMRYVFDGGTKIEAAAGDVLFLARGCHYYMENLSPLYSFVFVDFKFADTKGCTIDSEVFTLQSSRVIEPLFRRALEKWRLQKPAANEDCMAVLYSIYAELVRAKSSVYIPLSKRKQLDAAVQFISENFADETLTIETVANTTGMSESHFRRIFKTAYRISPIKYINLIRINRAKELISYSSASFSEIAAETGFSNLYYFSRIFKKEVGCTPSEYRDEYGDYKDT